MMIHPHDRDKHITDNVTQTGGPLRQQSAERVGLRWFELEDEDRNEYGEHRIGECSHPVRTGFPRCHCVSSVLVISFLQYPSVAVGIAEVGEARVVTAIRIGTRAEGATPAAVGVL